MAFSRKALCGLGLTEAELVAIRTSALAEVTSGKMTTSITAPGLATQMSIFATPIELLQAATYALQLLDSDTYGTPILTSEIGYTP